MISSTYRAYQIKDNLEAQHPELFADSLRKLAFFGLVQFENQSKKGYETATYVRITNTGIYYLTKLIYRCIYLDLVWMDTPILDKDLIRELLKHLVEVRAMKRAQDLDERFQRTEMFLDYLKNREEIEVTDNPQYLDSDLTSKQFLPEIIQSYEEKKKYIKPQRTPTKITVLEKLSKRLNDPFSKAISGIIVFCI